MIMTKEEFLDRCDHCQTKVILPDGHRIGKGKYMGRNGFDFDGLFDRLDEEFTMRFAERPDPFKHTPNGKVWYIDGRSENLKHFDKLKERGRVVMLEMSEGECTLKSGELSINISKINALCLLYFCGKDKELLRVEPINSPKTTNHG